MNTNYILLSGVGAAWKTAKVETGTTVAIFGLGAIGLAVCYLSIHFKSILLCF